MNHFAGLFGLRTIPAKAPARKPARTRRWVAWPLAASVALLAIPIPVAAAFELVGLYTLANATRTVPVVVHALTHEPFSGTKIERVREAFANQASPLLFVDAPSATRISGIVKNLPLGEFRIGLYLYVDPTTALRNGCRAYGWYGAKPIVGAMHKLKGGGGWSTPWQITVDGSGASPRVRAWVISARL